MPKAGDSGKQIVHDKELFERLLMVAQKIDPAVRAGNMFGCPAIYCGNKMATCVFGTEIGMRVPLETATQSVRLGQALPFQPFGKPAMKEWIKLKGGSDALGAGHDLIAAAIAFAQANSG